MALTLFDKVWDRHVVAVTEDGSNVLYIDRHYIHEVTSPQAFDTLRERQMPVWNVEQVTATADHNVPTKDQHLPIAEPLSRKQVDMLSTNCAEYGIELFGLGHQKQGIVHVIGPELGLTRPGMTIVCGDSHTSTHGAFGCIAFGIGTSQVAQVFATQCLILQKPMKMRISISGELGFGVTAKDIALYANAKLGTSGGTGYFIEYAGDAIEALSVEGRMTLCNMSIEMGARGGMIAPDQKTIEYVSQSAGQAIANEDAIAFWKGLKSDEDAVFDREYQFDATDIEPMISYGTNPGMAVGVSEHIPGIDIDAESESKALKYMGLFAGDQLVGTRIQHVFIGSCTNARIEDLRAAAAVVEGRKCAPHVSAMVIPGSMSVRDQAIREGLDTVFVDAGFDFRQPGCSACLGMNDDKIPAGEYCVSTSNRNFEGRQGPGARTLLASPVTAAACAVTGEITDVRTLMNAYANE